MGKVYMKSTHAIVANIDFDSNLNARTMFGLEQFLLDSGFP
jgi:hypothetical protein